MACYNLIHSLVHKPSKTSVYAITYIYVTIMKILSQIITFILWQFYELCPQKNSIFSQDNSRRRNIF